jgi:hypothetical protein
MLAHKIKERPIARRHFRGAPERSDTPTELLIINKKKTLIDTLFKGGSLLPGVTRQDFQAQLFSALAFLLFLGILLASIDPQSLKLVALYYAVVGQKTDQRFHQRPIEVRVLCLPKK